MDQDKFENFWSSFDDAFHKMIAQIPGLQLVDSTEATAMTGKRLAAIVGVVGLNKGRVHIGINKELAGQLFESVYGEPPGEEMDLCYYLAEFTNMVAGIGITKLNNTYRGLNLRLTPPAIFMGDNLEVSYQQVLSASKSYQTNLGTVRLDIGFEGV